MDDQNQNNQPLAQGATPVVPLDITPQDVAAPTAPAMTAPVPEPVAPPTEVAPTTPWLSPEPVTLPVETVPLSSPTPETTPTPLPLPTEPTSTPTEPPMPTAKPKNKLMPIIGGVMALLLVVGVAGAAYYVSNQLSTRRAVAPTAPESKPMATDICNSTVSEASCQGKNVGTTCTTTSTGAAGTCYISSASLKICICKVLTGTPTPTVTTTPACTAPGTCKPPITGSLCCGSQQHLDTTCPSELRCGAATTTPSPTYPLCSSDRKCTSLGQTACVAASGIYIPSKCGVAGSTAFGYCCEPKVLVTPSPTQTPNGPCIAGYTGCGSPYLVSGTCVKTCSVGGVACWVTATGCTGGTPTGTPTGGGNVCTRSAGSGAATSCYKTTTQSNVCNTAPFTFGCGMECCNTNFKPEVCCCTGCYPAGTDCALHTCGGGTTCDATKRDTPASKSITFAKTGKIYLFTRNAEGGTVTLTGPKTVTISTATGNAVQNPTTFQVTAGETYTIKLKFSDPSEQGKDAYGWIPNKSLNICGPVKDPGGAGHCGGDADITAVRTLAAANSDLSGITAGSATATIQCWGDAELGDATQDYDYNDATLILGYEKSSQEVGACMLIKIYKKSGTSYGTTPLTAAQLQTLQIGDVLKFVLDSSMDNLQGRFRVTINETAGTWLNGTIDATNKKLVTYSDFTIETAGQYKFEAQVSVTPFTP